MTDRESFLKAIIASPDDHIPRLVFADWLDEFGAGDLDATTVEFIRVSCSKIHKHRMPKEAYAWLHLNWKRLCPSLWTVHVPRQTVHQGVGKSDDDVLYYVKGRGVWMKINIPNPRYRADGERWEANLVPFYSCTVWLEFWKGFLLSVGMWSSFAKERLIPLLETDQPLWTMATDTRDVDAPKTPVLPLVRSTEE